MKDNAGKCEVNVLRDMFKYTKEKTDKLIRHLKKEEGPNLQGFRRRKGSRSCPGDEGREDYSPIPGRWITRM